MFEFCDKIYIIVSWENNLWQPFTEDEEAVVFILGIHAQVDSSQNDHSTGLE